MAQRVEQVGHAAAHVEAALARREAGPELALVPGHGLAPRPLVRVLGLGVLDAGPLEQPPVLWGISRGALAAALFQGKGWDTSTGDISDPVFKMEHWQMVSRLDSFSHRFTFFKKFKILINYLVKGVTRKMQNWQLWLWS